MAISVFDLFIKNKKNSYSTKDITLSINARYWNIQTCENLVRNGEYNPLYDLDGDGYVTADDYNTLYDRFYNKYETIMASEKGSLVAYSHLRKIVSGQLPYESMYDFNDDGVIDSSDQGMGADWLLFGKPERATFDDM